jgi:hypothetical protein
MGKNYEALRVAFLTGFYHALENIEHSGDYNGQPQEEVFAEWAAALPALTPDEYEADGIWYCGHCHRPMEKPTTCVACDYGSHSACLGLPCRCIHSPASDGETALEKFAREAGPAWDLARARRIHENALKELINAEIRVALAGDTEKL